jgi:hypothetical protein
MRTASKGQLPVPPCRPLLLSVAEFSYPKERAFKGMPM